MPVVVLDQAHWTQLEQVQMEIGRQVKYVSDMDRFGVPDWWEPSSKTGDCEDIALTKRKRLMDMGWPAELLRIAVLTDGHGELHAVLTVDVVSQKGAAGTYVLDSHFEHVEPWQALNQYGYYWLERSKPGSSEWARLDGDSPIGTQKIAGLSTMIMPASPMWSDGQAQTVRVKAYEPAAGGRAVDPIVRLQLALETDPALPGLDMDAGADAEPLMLAQEQPAETQDETAAANPPAAQAGAYRVRYVHPREHRHGRSRRS
jgi:predicted transglutaminase-like cysteine proteinase